MSTYYNNDKQYIWAFLKMKPTRKDREETPEIRCAATKKGECIRFPANGAIIAFQITKM